MTELEAALATFLPEQRWFAGKGRPIGEVRVRASVPLRTARPSLQVVVADVAYVDGGTERYHLPLGHDGGLEGQRFTAGHPGAVVLTTRAPREGSYYDATRDERLGAVFLDLIDRAATIEELRFYRSAGWGEKLRGPARLLDAEQTNSSLVFSNRLILKLFRRLEPGENPELELTRGLAAQGFDACAPPLGWFEGLGSTLGIVQRYHHGSVEGWQLATERVADHYDAGGGAGSFAAEAAELGQLTAALHLALAEAFPKVRAGQPDLGILSARLLGQLSQVIALVPELEPYREAIEAIYAGAARQAAGRHLQRIHGDYHLGQVLRTRGGGEPARWLVIDLEGEPARSLEERRRLASPLQDVAGMLRSFDYAASQPLVLGEDLDTPGPGSEELARLQTAAGDWVAANRAAFLEAYFARMGGAGLVVDGHELLLRALELDKAVYEVLYEARHRPAWLRIPLAGIRRILEQA